MSYDNYVCKMQDKGFNIWTDLFIPIIVSPCFLVIKIIYDRYVSNKDKANEIRKSNELDKIKNKLTKFYWPLYIRLLKDYDIWSHFNIFSESFYDYIDNEIFDSNDPVFELPRCQFKCNVVYDNITSIKYCNNPVHINSGYGSSIYCHKHKRHNINYDLDHFSDNILPRKKKNDINESNGKIISGNFTGSAVGEITGITDNKKETKTLLNKDLKDKLLNEMIINHQHIHDIIIDYIPIGEPNSTIGKELMKYLKFITIFKNITNDKNIDTVKYNSPYPKKLLPYIEKKVFKLQKRYNQLIEHFYSY